MNWGHWRQCLLPTINDKDFHLGYQRREEVFHNLNIDGAEEIFIKQCQISNKSYHFTF